MKKFFNVLMEVLCAFFVLILVINIVIFVQSMVNKDTVPSIFGYVPLIVLSDSMYPTLERGDLVIYHKESAYDVSVGDVITFYAPEETVRQTLVTHRVVEIVTDSGENEYRTKGDNNDVEDAELVPSENIVGVYRLKIPSVGKIALFMQNIGG